MALHCDSLLSIFFLSAYVRVGELVGFIRLSSTVVSRTCFPSPAYLTMSSTYFSSPDADLVLRSGDPSPVDFHVHRCVLATASPFFRDMLSLPQAPSEKVEVPVVPVSENYRTLEGLLRFVYPMPDPPVETLDEISSLLGAATKYDMTAAIDVLRRLLVAPQYVQASPTRVYAIASRYDLEEEAKIASRHTLGIDVLNCPLHEDLKYITAYAYHRLLNLHKRRAEAALELLKITEDVIKLYLYFLTLITTNILSESFDATA